MSEAAAEASECAPGHLAPGITDSHGRAGAFPELGPVMRWQGCPTVVAVGRPPKGND